MVRLQRGNRNPVRPARTAAVTVTQHARRGGRAWRQAGEVPDSVLTPPLADENGGGLSAAPTDIT